MPRKILPLAKLLIQWLLIVSLLVQLNQGADRENLSLLFVKTTCDKLFL